MLRQDPDVILVGELRDLETIRVAISAAETGHLVLATLHTQSAQDTISRVVDVFPAGQQQQIRTQLAATLQAVVCQVLVPSADGSGRVPAVEVMVCTEGIRAMIRDDKLQQIPGSLQAGGGTACRRSTPTWPSTSRPVGSARTRVWSTAPTSATSSRCWAGAAPPPRSGDAAARTATAATRRRRRLGPRRCPTPQRIRR